MSATEIQEIVMAVTAALGANQPTNTATATKENFPIGVIGRDHRSIMMAKSVNDLYTWDNHVQAEDGGTFKGSKVAYLGTRKLEHNPKARSKREQWMATFNVCRPEGRNVINEVINIFIKSEYDYRPYLMPEKWSYDEVIIDMISEDDSEKPRKIRVKIHAFDGFPVSDSVEQKCRYLMSTPDLKGTMYTPFIDGKRVEID